MSVNREQLQEHLDDYERETGKRSDRFVCPITLRECDESELINGHILNKALNRASRRTLIQYREVDNFYGRTVEPDLVRFLNLKDKTPLDFIKASPTITLTFADGSTAPAFFADSPAARKAAAKYPVVDLIQDGSVVASVFVKTPMDDRRLTGQVEYTHREGFFPWHWIAGMLKVGHLTMFDMFGYRAVFEPFGFSLRRQLSAFFEDKGGRGDAEKYFWHFRKAIKILLNKDGEGQLINTPYRFDTIHDQEVWMHMTPCDTIFAISCIYKINDVLTSVILPQCADGGDVALCEEWYQKLMDDDTLPHKVHRARLEKDGWKLETKPMPVHYLPEGTNLKDVSYEAPETDSSS